MSGGNKKPALDERGRENVSITGEVMWSTNSMTAKQEEGSTGIYSGIVPEHLLIENEEPDISRGSLAGERRGQVGSAARAL